MNIELQIKINARMEAAHNFALEAIAMGASRDETMHYIRKQFPYSRPDVWNIAMGAFKEAQEQGVERTDIHTSWFRR